MVEDRVPERDPVSIIYLQDDGRPVPSQQRLNRGSPKRDTGCPGLQTDLKVCLNESGRREPMLWSVFGEGVEGSMVGPTVDSRYSRRSHTSLKGTIYDVKETTPVSMGVYGTVYLVYRKRLLWGLWALVSRGELNNLCRGGSDLGSFWARVDLRVEGERVVGTFIFSTEGEGEGRNVPRGYVF